MRPADPARRQARNLTQPAYGLKGGGTMGEQNLDLAAYLERLKEQRARLDIQIAGVLAALGLAQEDGAAPPSVSLSGTPAATGTLTTQVIPGRIRPDEFFGLSIPEAIKKFLAIMKQPQSPKAMVDGLQAGGLLTNAKNFYPNVTTALKRLRLADQVVLTPNGWGLRSWYQNLPKSADEGKRGHGGRKKRSPKGAAKRRASGATPAHPEASSQRATTPATSNGARKPKSGYLAFVADQMKAGKSMADAAAEWRKQKAAH